ncbi:MAG TPA: hypothetical protein VFS53_01265, partial [Gemmatimonadota bacterium]|nr:hypothetical protein [Gemmatimonadota bacterium]
SAEAAALQRARPAEKTGLDAAADEGREPFEAAARDARATGDTAAARRALALWADSLLPAEREVPPRPALADSLERLLEAGP